MPPPDWSQYRRHPHRRPLGAGVGGGAHPAARPALRLAEVFLHEDLGGRQETGGNLKISRLLPALNIPTR